MDDPLTAFYQFSGDSGNDKIFNADLAGFDDLIKDLDVDWPDDNPVLLGDRLAIMIRDNTGFVANFQAVLLGRDGDDELYGGNGDEIFYPGTGYDVVDTGAGNDFVWMDRDNVVGIFFGPGSTLVRPIIGSSRDVDSGIFMLGGFFDSPLNEIKIICPVTDVYPPEDEPVISSASLDTLGCKPGDDQLLYLTIENDIYYFTLMNIEDRTEETCLEIDGCSLTEEVAPHVACNESDPRTTCAPTE